MKTLPHETVNVSFTPTEQRILGVMADGKAHLLQELAACLWDELGCSSNVHRHITAIRKILRPKGEDIIYRDVAGQSWYSHVRIVSIR